jgi:spore maturation protein CgeB
MIDLNAKSILFLVSADDNQYINYLRDFIKTKTRDFQCLNFVDYAQKKGVSAAEKYLQTFVRERTVDIVIVSPFATDYHLSVEFFAGLSRDVKLIFWMFDDENYFDDYSVYYCQAAHAVITTDYFAVNAYKKYNIPAVLYVPAFPKEKYHPGTREKDIDVSFVGDYTKSDRRRYIEYLLKNGINVQVFGKGSKNGFVPGENIPEIFSRSKINLNFTKTDSLSWINKRNPLLRRVRQNKGRPIEVALTRSFCLSENAPAMNAMLEIGKEIDVFNDKYELLEKVKYYLSRSSERENIARNACHRALSDYDAESYIPKVINEAVDLADRNRNVPTTYLSWNFKKNAVNGLTFSMFVMIKNSKIAAAADTFIRLFSYGSVAFAAGITGGVLRSLKRIFAAGGDNKHGN